MLIMDVASVYLYLDALPVVTDPGIRHRLFMIQQEMHPHVEFVRKVYGGLPDINVDSVGKNCHRHLHQLDVNISGRIGRADLEYFGRVKPRVLAKMLPIMVDGVSRPAALPPPAG